MEQIVIPNEADIKRWVKEACEETLMQWLEKMRHAKAGSLQANAPLLTRRDAAKIFGISLVTLHSWMKKGLPHHHHEGRVYFVRSELLRYLNIAEE